MIKSWKKQHLPSLRWNFFSTLSSLQVDVEQRGFEQMDKFEKFSNMCRILRHQQHMRQFTLDAFAWKWTFFRSLINNNNTWSICVIPVYNVIRFRRFSYNAVNHKHFCANELQKVAHRLIIPKSSTTKVDLISGYYWS